MNFMTIVGFIFMLVLMCILVSGKAAPPVVFTVLPIIVSLILGFSLNEITEFIETGMASILRVRIDTICVGAIVFTFTAITLKSTLFRMTDAPMHGQLSFS